MWDERTTNVCGVSSWRTVDRVSSELVYSKVDNLDIASSAHLRHSPHVRNASGLHGMDCSRELACDGRNLSSIFSMYAV